MHCDGRYVRVAPDGFLPADFNPKTRHEVQLRVRSWPCGAVGAEPDLYTRRLSRCTCCRSRAISSVSVFFSLGWAFEFGRCEEISVRDEPDCLRAFAFTRAIRCVTHFVENNFSCLTPKSAIGAGQSGRTRRRPSPVAIATENNGYVDFLSVLSQRNSY